MNVVALTCTEQPGDGHLPFPELKLQLTRHAPHPLIARHIDFCIGIHNGVETLAFFHLPMNEI